MKLHTFENQNFLNQHFACLLAEILSQAIIQRGRAYLVVSGGKTPISLFDELAKLPLSWSKVTVTLTDERCIPISDKDSNEYWVRNVLLQGNASQAAFVSLLEKNAPVASLPSFDAVILGMGEDGHTASLFPCSPEITHGLSDDNDASLLSIHPATAPYSRVSMTKKRLLNCRNLFLHLIGERKWAVLDEAIKGSNIYKMPIRAFLQSTTPEIQVMYALKC